MTRFACVLCVVVLAACGGDISTLDAGRDAGGIDAALDAPGIDAPGTDAPTGDAPPCTDADGDGHGATSCGGDDCDDADPHRFPRNAELCDSVDQDCDPATLGPDSDGDGSPATSCCNPSPTGGSPVCGTDCDDLRATVNATAIEACNGVDDNCDGRIDEGVPMMTCFDDSDGDTYAPTGAASHMACACTSTQTTRAPVGSDVDCNDANAMVHPTAVDICDGLDNDCDGTPDNGSGAAYYQDCDVDGFGDMSVSRLGCTVPTVPTSCAGGVWRAMPFDCDDTRASVHPGATETCNGRDDDCNAMSDDVGIATVASDDANCGACGHACRHPGCVAGVCSDDYVEVQVGTTHSCARRGSGAVDCWGSNAYGELGDGTTMQRSTPVRVVGVTDAVELALAGDEGGWSCALRRSGSLSCWGSALDLTRGDYSGAHHITAEPYFGFMVTTDRGCESAYPTFGTWHRLDLAGAAECHSWTTSTSSYGSCARSPGGTIQCDGRTVAGVDDAVSFDCWGECIAVRATGTLVTWDPSATTVVASPVAPLLVDATRVAGASQLVLRRTRQVASHYDGSAFPQLMSVSDVVSATDANGPFPLGSSATHGCALRATGEVVCWGRNTYGQLGDGTTTDSYFPVTVSGS